MGKVRHPAKFSSPIMSVFSTIFDWVQPKRILDPFAGTGRIHELGLDSWGVEIEPEWAFIHPRTIVGNALHLPFRDGAFDTIVTSPTYGNRMADRHNAKDSSVRNTYKHTLGRDLHPDNSGQLQWGDKYREFHLKAWSEVARVLTPDGYFVLNVSDHIRKGEVVRVADWHAQVLTLQFGLFLRAEIPVETRRQRQGANGDARVPHEYVFVFQGKAL